MINFLGRRSVIMDVYGRIEGVLLWSPNHKKRERVVGREELRRINIFSQALSNCPAGISLLI